MKFIILEVKIIEKKRIKWKITGLASA